MSYDVGYRKPPVHSRFAPGRSGNPKGRSKGAKGFAAELERELAAKIAITENSRRRRITKSVAMIMSQVAKAIKGDTRAFANIHALRSPQAKDSEASATDQSIDRMIMEEFAKQVRENDGTR